MSTQLDTDLHTSYLLAREAQDARCEAATMGYPAEIAEYYGRGEYAGSGTEQRVTWKTWLQSAAGEERAWRETCAAVDAEVGQPPTDDELIQPWDLDPAPWDDTPAQAPATDPATAFRMTGRRLAILAAAGDAGAAAEITRRAARRATKRAAHAAA